MNTAATTKLLASGAIKVPTSLAAPGTPFEVAPALLCAISQPVGSPALNRSGNARVLPIVSNSSADECGDRSHPLTSHGNKLATAIGVAVLWCWEAKDRGSRSLRSR